MKTAEEIYMEIQDIENPRLNNLTLPDGWQIKAIKEYANQVAEQALHQASENATTKVDTSRNGSKIIVNKQSILNTEIVTP